MALSALLHHALAAASTPPAGGAATQDIVIATLGAVVVSVVLLTPVVLYKAGRFAGLERLSAFADRVSGIPGWAALPGTFLLGTLAIALFGMYWDVSIHLDNGRDPGPLANTAHYFILAGLFGVLLAGVLAMALPTARTRTSIRIPIIGWEAPVGALMIALCGSFSLIAFPLDDIWHRLFGQDVTLWGPTHLMLIGGASLSILGAWALHVEGASSRLAEGRTLPVWTRWREHALAGGFLIGLCTFQDEFDLGIPQFRLIFHPLLIMLAAGVGLTAARIRLGRGGALFALSQFLIIRAILSVLVGPIFGHTLTHIPPFVVEALCVEGVALVAMRRGPISARPITFGALAGLAIGTIGLAAEWGWSHVWVVIPWPASLFPEGAILGFVAALAGGVVGGFIGRSLTPGEPRSERLPAWTAPLAAFAIVGAIAWALPMSGGDGRLSATVALRDVTPPPHRTVQATVRVNPPGAARNADWFNVTNWQGKAGASTVQRLRQVGPGTYETTTPIRVSDRWKATLRLAKGRDVLGLPIFLPADPAIPATEVSAASQFTRPFILDKKNLQREQKAGVSPAISLFAYLVVLAVSLVVLATIAWGLRRLERTGAGPTPPPRPEPRSTHAPLPASPAAPSTPPAAPA
jgi:hypothetical protein